MDCVSDEAVRSELRLLAGCERSALAQSLRLLADIDSRGAARAWGYSSLFAFCVQEMRLSEAGAYRRVSAARAARRWPEIFGMIERGELNADGVGILWPYLEERGRALLAAARGKTLRQLRELVGLSRSGRARRERRARQLGLSLA